jgi:purine-binding chemotaxis protein CheW
LPDAHLPTNVVMHTDGGAVSFLVDEIGDVLEADEQNFEPPPETLQGQARELVRAVCKLPERLMLVLDAQRAVFYAGPLPGASIDSSRSF